MAHRNAGPRQFIAAALALAGSAASAQFLGHNIAGDYGLQSASQPLPGLYLSALYFGYHADTLRDRDGNAVSIDLQQRGSLDVNGYSLGLVHVTQWRLFGANYSYMIAPSWTDNVLSAPILGLTQETSVGYSDLYVQPINLGWHTPRTDYTAGLGLFAPTGRFDFDADDNLGMGMWSVELFGGTTVYFDAAQTWHFAIMGFYEMHSKKEGTDLRVGDIMTLEGGLGKSFMQGALTAGLSYYAQWKVTDDDLGTDATLPEQFNPGRNRGFGIDPEITLPPMTKRSIFSFFNLRYFWETGNRSTVEGQTLVASLTFPIPSVPID